MYQMQIWQMLLMTFATFLLMRHLTNKTINQYDIWQIKQLTDMTFDRWDMTHATHDIETDIKTKRNIPVNKMFLKILIFFIYGMQISLK